jgi:hypothetical protein
VVLSLSQSTEASFLEEEASSALVATLGLDLGLYISSNISPLKEGDRGKEREKERRAMGSLWTLEKLVY